MLTSKQCMELEATYGAKNYKPIPVVITKAKGSWVWDPEGKKYLDCLSAYSAVNQGHLHPRVVEAVKAQMEKLTIVEVLPWKLLLAVMISAWLLATPLIW